MSTQTEPKTRIGIFMGGVSEEREQSFVSGRQVFYKLDRAKYEVIPIFVDLDAKFWILPPKLIPQGKTSDVVRKLQQAATRLLYEDVKSKIDIAFILTHGKYGEDGCLQGLFELLDITYTSSGILSSALGLDKDSQRVILQQAGIRIPESIIIREEDIVTNLKETLEKVKKCTGLPCAVKPTREGSSVGVSIARNEAELKAGIKKALQYDKTVFVEKFLKGLEFSCIVVGTKSPQALPPTEIVPKSDFFTYEDKFTPGGAHLITPARLQEKLLKKVQQEAIKAHKALGFSGYSRIDGFVVGEEVFIIDPHPTCGMGPSSFIWQQAAEAELAPKDLLDRIVQDAFSVHAEKKGCLG